MLTDSTDKNLKIRVEAEDGATAGKTNLAKRATALNLDAFMTLYIKTRHGKAFKGLPERFLGSIINNHSL